MSILERKSSVFSLLVLTPSFFSLRAVERIQGFLQRLCIKFQKLSEEQRKEFRIQRRYLDFLNEIPDVSYTDTEYVPVEKLFFKLQDALEESNLSKREALTVVKSLLHIYSRMLAEQEEETVLGRKKIE